jgi:cell wall-associated NlpC family hydrolase
MNGICTLAVIPLRKQPDSTSEIVSQLLFGDEYTIIQIENGWANINTIADNYNGYISEKQVTPYHQEIKHWKTNTLFPFAQVNSSVGTLYLPAGCSLPEQQQFSIGNTTFEQVTANGPSKPLDELALQYLNAPYLWGGKTFFGIDCSGFIQMVFKQIGLVLPRDAYQQAELGEAVAFVEECKLGDLAFFDNENGKITHVGLMLNKHQIIHASGKVRLDILDHHGIMNLEEKQYSHKLRIIKRIL